MGFGRGKTEIGRAMTQLISRRPLSTGTPVRSQTSACEICRERSGAGTEFPLSISVFRYQYHFAIFPYSLTDIPPKLYNLSN